MKNVRIRNILIGLVLYLIYLVLAALLANSLAQEIQNPITRRNIIGGIFVIPLGLLLLYFGYSENKKTKK